MGTSPDATDTLESATLSIAQFLGAMIDAASRDTAIPVSDPAV